MFAPVREISNIYGPYAFGVISLLLIWFTIVKPELANRSLDFAAQNEILISLTDRDRTQSEIARSLASTAESIQLTAKILERAVERMEGREK